MLRQWKINWNIALNNDSPVYKQIEKNIIIEISKGRLASGTPMPGSRELASHLKVNRNTVAKAYEQLVVKGWLQVKGKRGTFVADPLPVAITTNGNGHTKEQKAAFSFNIFGVEQLPFTITETNWQVRFDDGFPDPHLAPIQELNSTYKRIFNWKMRQKKMEFQNSNVYRPMQELFTNMLNQSRGFSLNSDSVVFIMGQQITMYMVARVLLKKGDAVVMGSPGNALAQHIFESCYAEVLPCATDEEGLDTEQLETICKGRKIKAVYLSPQGEYPTTATLSASRSAHLLKLANQHNFAVIESDYDHEYWYGEQPFIPLAANDTDGRVIYISAVSKMLPPFFLMGVVAGPPDFIRSLRILQGMIGQQGDIVLETAVEELIHEGTIPRYARKSINLYREKRDNAGSVLDNYLHRYATFTKPQSGLAYWIKFKEDTDIQKLLMQLQQKGIFIPNPNTLIYSDTTLPAIRIGFGSIDLRELEQGTKAIAEILKAQ